MCFSLGWIENLLIACVIIAAVIMVIRIIIPWLCSLVGWPNTGPVIQVLNIVCGAVVIIFLIILVFALLSCAFGGGGGLPFRFR